MSTITTETENTAPPTVKWQSESYVDGVESIVQFELAIEPANYDAIKKILAAAFDVLDAHQESTVEVVDEDEMCLEHLSKACDEAQAASVVLSHKPCHGEIRKGKRQSTIGA